MRGKVSGEGGERGGGRGRWKWRVEKGVRGVGEWGG